MTKTPEKPALSLVSTTGISPPRQLGPYGGQLWARIQGEYGITDTGGIEILAQLCAALDRAEGLAAAIARDGEVIYSRTGVPRTHPACREELTCRAFITRGLERLGLNVEAVRPQGRPTQPFGWVPPESGTRRTPISRQADAPRITPRSLELFIELERAQRARRRASDCTLDNRRGYCSGQCRACRLWADAHDALHVELGLDPWKWPCLPRNPYPPGSPSAKSWRGSEEARALWDTLEAARRAAIN